MFPVLQVAFDVTELVRVVDIASKIALATKCERVWMEAGTPLLKSWGKLAVRALKELVGCYVVADTKTMDVPSIEAKIVFDAGADAFTVLGVADEDTLKEAVDIKRQYGKQLFIDLIGCSDPYKRALEVAKYEPDALLFHIGISAQRVRGISGSELLMEAIRAKRETGIRVGIAGGLKPGGIKPLIDQGVDIVIVGSAITSAPNPVDVAISILRELSEA